MIIKNCLIPRQQIKKIKKEEDRNHIYFVKLPIHGFQFKFKSFPSNTSTEQTTEPLYYIQKNLSH